MQKSAELCAKPGNREMSVQEAEAINYFSAGRLLKYVSLAC